MNELAIVEFENHRVLTTQQLADAYETDAKVISKNFERNKERYKEGVHYYVLSGQELSNFKGCRQIDDTLSPTEGALKYISILYLWTERGALRHAKSLGTDKAWEVYEMLEDSYFKVRQQVPQTLPEALRMAADIAEQNMKLIKENERLKPKEEFFDAVAESKDAMPIGDAAKVLNLGFGRNRLFEFLREKGVLMQDNRPYQKYIDCGYFRLIEQKWNTPNGETKINIKTLVYQKGLNYISKLIKANGDREINI
jgi:phage antirepressor YoqD-like protein